MKFNGIIYCRTNIVNGKKYIGQTTNEKQREYSWNNMNTIYSGNLINKARKKYGISSFTYTVLGKCEADTKKELDEMLNSLEIYYIEKYNTKAPNGYNLTEGGGGMRGYHYTPTDEHKQKISESTKGKKKTRKIQSDSRKGRPISKEILNKKLANGVIHNVYQYNNDGELVKKWDYAISAKVFGYNPREIRKCCRDNGKRKHNGYVWSYKELTKSEVLFKYSPNKCSETTKSKISKAKSLKVYQYTLEGDLVKEWESIADAVRNGFSSGHICKCCKGERNKHKGFIWSYNKIDKK